ncbi:MAG: diguanylate cyclase [Desulfobulbaceae bacterium]|nr:MAG: diguanylate cyclase [Desulfobulbaceae bacterium]
MKTIFLKILHAGISQEIPADDRKKILITSLFSLVSILLLSFFGSVNLLQGNVTLGIITLSAALLSLSNYIYLCIYKNYRVTSFFIVLLMSILCLYLLISGGNNNTGPLWFFVVPVLAYYVTGLRTGTIYLVALLGVVGLVLFLPSESWFKATYQLEFSIRFFASLVSVSIVAFAYEYTRTQGENEMLHLNHQLDRMSQTDDLTGLANRRAMTKHIDHEINRFERNKRPFCLLLGDLDHFKSVNDRFGHECGDLLLIEVAKKLDNKTKKQDIVSRWGGEEFLILLPETTLEQARYMTERLRQSIEMLTITYRGVAIGVTMSFGISAYQSSQSFNDLLRDTDDKLYKAKHSGRNRVASA